MKLLKKIIKKYFGSFVFYYSFLGYRSFVLLSLSLLIGVLDGFGLTMFLPLLQLVDDSSDVNSESLGKLSFLIDFMTDAGISLTLVSILLLMVIFFFLKGIITYFAGIYKVNVQQWFIKNIHIANITGLNSISYKYFLKSDGGRIQNTVTSEVGRVGTSYLNYFGTLEYGILVFVYMIFAFIINAQFALLVTIGGILTNFLYNNLYKNTKGVSRKLTGESNIFHGLIMQNVSNYKYLKATGALKKYTAKVIKSAEGLEKQSKRIGKLDALLTAGREPLLITVVVVVIYVQTNFLGSNLGSILVSLLFFYRALNYLMQMQVRWNRFLAVSGSLENMMKFKKELNDNREKPGHSNFTENFQNLKLKYLNFNYGSTKILKDISLNIKKNETIAFVGESGSGKTTLVNIIAGLLPSTSGEYLINSKNIREVNVNDWQEKIGYITQDPVIFNDTLFNNVTFWAEKNDVNINRFWEVLKQAAIYKFVSEELELKENTILGNNGINLSGGQRQRISIARELYKSIEVLILDEATSALDSETEREIQKNIDALKGNYTILIVAHRLSTIKAADRIVVMKNGKIIDIGNFSTLLEQSNYFKMLVELQEV